MPAAESIETIPETDDRSEQSTVRRSVHCRGVGLHGGREVTLDLCPAPVGSGIEFVIRSPRGDVVSEIPALASSVVSDRRATALGDGKGASVSTVEHLLAVLNVLGIDNARIEVQGDELPVLDGSAQLFLDWVRSAGRQRQSLPRRFLGVVRPLRIVDGDRSISIEPASRLAIEYAIDFAHPCIGRQTISLPGVDEKVFELEIAGARTFGFEHEIASLREQGLGLGGSAENVVVVGEAGILNESGLRWPDEFVRHKVIDLLGDLALLGRPLRGRIRVERGGHALHHRLVTALLEDAAELVARDAAV